ncbi:hypothetical protein LguiA_019654 [Lonicera macranthoides]
MDRRQRSNHRRWWHWDREDGHERKCIFGVLDENTPLNAIMCLAHGLISSNLIAKLDRMAKLVLTLKLDGQSGSVLSLMAKVVFK